jgi:high-affinity gluconate transporter
MLVLNLRFKMNSMVALLLAALSVGMLAGMDLMALLHTMKSGFGSTLGELAIIVVFGAVIGKLMVDSGRRIRLLIRCWRDSGCAMCSCR